jgi:hypothetical protein
MILSASSIVAQLSPNISFRAGDVKRGAGGRITTLGRYLYGIGANPRAAALNGMPVGRYVMGGVFGVDDDQARAGECLGHDGWGRDSGDWDFGDSVIWRPILGRAVVQMA